MLEPKVYQEADANNDAGSIEIGFQVKHFDILVYVVSHNTKRHRPPRRWFSLASHVEIPKMLLPQNPSTAYKLA